MHSVLDAEMPLRNGVRNVVSGEMEHSMFSNWMIMIIQMVQSFPGTKRSKRQNSVVNAEQAFKTNGQQMNNVPFSPIRWFETYGKKGVIQH